MKVEADTREEAVAKLQDMMDESAVREHMEAKHEGEPMPDVKEVHLMIATRTEPAEAFA